MLPAFLVAASNTLKKMEVVNHELRLSFSSWLNKDNIHQMVLDNPPRQVIDIKNTKLAKGGMASKLSAKGVRSFRVAQRGKHGVRIVIESYGGYKCKGYQPMVPRTEYRIPLPKKGKTGNTIAASRKSTKHSAKKKEEHKSKSSPKKIAKAEHKAKAKPAAKPKPKKTVKKTATKKTATRKQRSSTTEKSSFFSSLFKSKSLRPRGHYTVVVDAGHGGHDSGAIGGGRYEKTLVLQVAKYVAKELKSRGYSVKMTRSTDRFIKLKHRTHFANEKKADIFVSIHANAIANKKRFSSVYGVETYFLQTTRSARAKRIAAIENSVVLDKNDYLSNNVILQAVLSGPKIELSHKLAIDVQSKILSHLRHKYRGVKDGGVKPAPFWVLVGAQMPSILIEVGYITNPIERHRLFSADYQKRIAKGVADGISNYLILREKEMY